MLQEGQQLSHYQLVRLLKSGGMGEVYLAVDTLLHRQVAIKVIDTDSFHHAEADAAKEAARLFLREAQAIAQLDQINILPLYDSGEDHVHGTSLMYMVMPYRQAGSLKDWLRTHFAQEPLPLAAVERIIRQAALALQHAHDRKIVHQDVKPSNFLVHGNADHPSRLNLQLADFGVAKLMMMTSESQVIRGTPTYMAPEQWDGRPVPATDQYALAVMAYELLVGRPPFVGNGYQMLWNQHCHVEPTPPSTINPKLPQELDAVFLRALAKNPNHRYSSVLEFAHAFQRAVLNSANVYLSVTISMLEAHTGTNRLISLPAGQQMMLPIPPGVYNGQVMRLEGYGRPTTYSSPPGALIVTIVIAAVDETIFPATPTIQQTVQVSPPFVKKNEISPSLSPVSSHRRQNRGMATLMIAIVLVLLAGSIGIYFIASFSAFTPPPNHATATAPALDGTHSTATATYIEATRYPSYLPGSGILALYDPLKDDSEGYVWNPPNFPYCYFQGGALHAKVFGGTTNQAYFHPCIGQTPIFRDFAYEVKMTFIQGDCGGIVLRAGDPDHDPRLYYYYICQNGQYALVRYTQNVSDPKTNMTLRTGTSQFIEAGSSQANIIAVVAMGSNLDLYVNKQHIDSVQDASYSDGKIGVLTKTFDLLRPAEVMFSYATVWTF